MISVPLLEIRDAAKVFGGGLLTRGKRVTALRGCSLAIPREPASICAIAGESGSGKSTLAAAVLGFVKLDAGAVLFQGQDVAAMNRRQMFEYRRHVQAIFQDPYAAFNPFYRVRHIFDIVLRRFHLARTRRDAHAKVEAALAKVGLKGADVLDKFPHQLSGGQRQRLMVARACLMSPRLIVADEPVSMIDASLRHAVLDIMLRMRDEDGISFLYITHDLSTAYQVADEIHILYRGNVVESGPVQSVLGEPRYPYTQLLIQCIPPPDPAQRWADTVPPAREHALPGGTGCCFHHRCPERFERCALEVPPLIPSGPGVHKTACHARNPGATPPAG